MIPGGQNNFYLAHENIWTTEVKNFASFATELQGTIRRRGHRGEGHFLAIPNPDSELFTSCACTYPI